MTRSLPVILGQRLLYPVFRRLPYRVLGLSCQTRHAFRRKRDERSLHRTLAASDYKYVSHIVLMMIGISFPIIEIEVIILSLFHDTLSATFSKSYILLICQVYVNRHEHFLVAIRDYSS